MSLRLKLSLMLSAFLVLIAVFASATLVIFGKWTVNVGDFSSMSREFKAAGDLENSINAFLSVTNDWSLTGDERFKRKYGEKLSDLRESFRSAENSMQQAQEVAKIEHEFQAVIDYSQHVFSVSRPVGDGEVLNYLQMINAKGRRAIDSIAQLQESTSVRLLDSASRAEEMKRNLIFYLIALIAFSAFAAMFLIIRIRRTVAEPFNILLRATERIGRGELSFRVAMDRKDEFGVIANSFNDMAADLESSHGKVKRKLVETELFLDVARIAGPTLDLKDALPRIAETIALKLKYDRCLIFMLTPGSKTFSLEGSSTSGDTNEDIHFDADRGIAGEVMITVKPRVIDDTSAYAGEEPGLKEKYRSVAAVPILRENSCFGILFVGNRSHSVFSADEVSALTILAHTIGSAVMNAELYLSTTKQLQKLTVLYELSRAVTSVLDLEGLLQRIAGEMARLLSARGCIIRLLENDRLKIKSHYGLPAGIEDKMELSLGEGIAGRVAEQKTSLLVEDVAKMPEGMHVPVIDVKSVVCVPLKIGDTVIGTLGLYDKYDAKGSPVPFTSDDLGTAEGFASISAIAIEKSKLYEMEVRREEEAREAKKRLDILFDSVQGGIITLDRDYTILSANRYVEDWVGITAEELIGRNCLDIFHEKIGICPHCAAKATFATGEINSIMQSKGMNYAELTAYPVKNEAGEVADCVVFILDITERVLYQEETLSLYREVIQTKEYLESIIENSADSIVATDLEGTVTSWNQGAEKIFGYTEAEAMGKFLPFVPEFLLDRERGYVEKIKTGEILKDIETLRRRKDGTIIEVSLTLSPIKDAAGKIIGISGISRDISEKKSVEKELIRRNQELSRLFFISSAMRGTLELDKVLRMVLIAVTMSDGMGFNRAILFLVDDAKKVLRGAMGVGPESPEDAWKIWGELSMQKKTLDDIMQEVIQNPMKKNSFLDRLSAGIEIPMEKDTILTRAVKEKRPFNVADVKEEPLSDPLLIQQLGTQAYAIVPLISRDKVIGLIWVDNYFNRKQITEEDMKFLASFSNHVASAIENARLFEQVTMAEQQLENIFESMSDMVYFNSKDYVIMSINKAVSSRLGRPASEIIGKKCYEVFHGTNEPYAMCPHHKTVETKKAYIEELEDPYLGGTFLTSSSPIFDLNGEFIGSVHVVRDVTELKSLQEKLVLAEKMAALGEVAAKVAHEIRNPLVSVGGFAKRLEKKLEGNLKEYAAIIVREVERLEGILKEILGFVKEVRLFKEVVNLNTLIDDVVTLIASDTEEKGIVLVKDYGPPSQVFVDPNRVKEAILNILANSVQSIAGSGSISLRTYVKGGYAAVEIRDTGRGIPGGDLPFIFNPFFTTKAAGTGLGLAITHRIIQEHGGLIEVESEMDKGSVFRVFIPLKEG
jgi:PAS domain S-box-containing protein